MQSDDSEFDSLLDQVVLGDNWKRLAKQTTDKDYRRIVSFDNCTSYSQTQDLHACPRRYQLIKAEAKTDAGADPVQQTNLDFAFGHSVGAGVQTLIATGKLVAGLFAGFISWKADYFADLDELNAGYGRRTRKNKSLAYAQLAIEKFFAQGLTKDWEIYLLPDGSPAVELAFCVDTQNGFQHYGHIDLILRHLESKRIAVWELKTNGSNDIDEATYANSNQALGYGVVLDYIEPDLADYDVIYAVYSTSSMEWHILPFRKSLTQKAEWLADILLDHNNISTYRKMGFFPKRGESCRQYNRRCKFFGICDLTSHVSYVDLPIERQAENVNFLITKDDIIQNQRSKA